jgi:hypothetical protein
MILHKVSMKDFSSIEWNTLRQEPLQPQTGGEDDLHKDCFDKVEQLNVHLEKAISQIPLVNIAMAD